MAQEQKITAEELRIDRSVGLTALRLYIENSNMEVGQVTVRHLVFSELIVQIRAAKGLKDAEEVFKLCFKNKHTVAEGKGKKVYESPLTEGCYTDEFGIKCIKISPRLADLVVEEVKLMEINEANVIAACNDLQICGRMFQELTIDAAKTMLKVTIPYGEDMIHVKLNSREQEEENFNAKCDWKYHNSTEEERQQQAAAALRKQVVDGVRAMKRYQSVAYVLNKDESKTTYDQRGTSKIFVRHIADFHNELRISLLTRGLEFADRMMNEEQEIDLQVRADITAAMRRPEMKEAYQLCVFFHDAFRTIQSYQSKSIVDANQVYPKKSAALEEHVKGIKADAKKAIGALSNQFRVEFAKLGLSDLDMVYALLHTVLTEGNNASYAHTVLEQEFFKFAIDSMKDDENTPQYSEDKLLRCDFDEGDIVTFMAGKAVKEYKKAYAAVPLCGEFIIRKNKHGKLVASQKITDIVKTPAVDADKLIFITKPGGGKDNYTSTHLQDITKTIMAPGVRVILVPYIKGQDIHDAIVVNGVVIGSFRCSYGTNGRPVSPKIVTNMYLYKEGIADHVIVSNQGSSVGQVAVITLHDVKTVTAPTITADKIKEDQAAVTATVKATLENYRKSAVSMFGFIDEDDKNDKIMPNIKQEQEEAEDNEEPAKPENKPVVTGAMFKRMFGFEFNF